MNAVNRICREKTSNDEVPVSHRILQRLHASCHFRSSGNPEEGLPIHQELGPRSPPSQDKLRGADGNMSDHLFV